MLSVILCLVYALLSIGSPRRLFVVVVAMHDKAMCAAATWVADSTDNRKSRVAWVVGCVLEREQ